MGQLNLNLGVDADSASLRQLSNAAEELATGGSAASRGAVFTRVEVVNFILDLAGYTEDQPLYQQCLLEPAFGGGEFLCQIIKRLITAWHRAKRRQPAVADLNNAIRGIELHRETFHSTRSVVMNQLIHEGLSPAVSSQLANCWISQGDFLLTPLEFQFDFVIGNPPYVRQELIPAPLLAEYRRRYQTIYDRADLYVPFIERSLSLLSKGGRLGFICADRWMKNRYGGPLRKLISKQFHLKFYVDMFDTPAFNSNVIAYPAITIISREDADITRMAYRPTIEETSLRALSRSLQAESPTCLPEDVLAATDVVNGSEPWLLDSTAELPLVRRLEKLFPTLEEAGCKVGIGVATGADKVFIGPFNELDVELDRRLPLVMTKDIATGEVVWQGKGVINPFSDQGGLVDLSNYPRLRRYLEAHRSIVANRHCAKKYPANWYRTIDRITPELLSTPKLLIPDIKGEAHIVLDRGELYPHHNLYYVTSSEWNLRALQAVLLSMVSRLFISTYSTKMQGGFFRFQAQYLRRIRIPQWRDVPASIRTQLIDASMNRDLEECDRLTTNLYDLSATERQALSKRGR